MAYEYSKKIDRYLKAVDANKASDLHIKTNMQPIIRVGSLLTSIDTDALTSDEIKEFVDKITDKKQKEYFEEFHEVDISFSGAGSRFRCNAYMDMSGYNVSIRRVLLNQFDFNTLRIPEVIKTLALKKSGLILVTGPTGSGKSTTLSSVINYLNSTINAHIITLEDPIECIHEPNTCLITQREIGRDTTSYYKGLVAAMRQDPDVIMLGEMRDLESVSTAVSAAETGHLVLSTLHTKGAENTIDRIIDMFPAGQQNQIRVQLSMVLLGVFSQQLVPSVKDNKRVLATEIMIATGAIKNLIRTGKTHLITSTLQTARGLGMHTMDYCLQELYENGLISQESVEMYSFDTTVSMR